MRPFVKPLTTRECADYVGFSTEWIRRAITLGVALEGGRVVKLEAETLARPTRTMYRIHSDAFATFLHAIGRTHVPPRVNGNGHETT